MSVTATERRYGREPYPLNEAEIDWRKSRLSKLGANDDAAAYGAAAAELDLHDLERLVDGGCPLDLALEILT